ncbi:hypothetical protein VJ923_10635 [Adlercreutzia sp. R25]|uniref:hypothetical protein n=1 Tax=Adlercreutzia shanghongiae TaxID=3111773 RepID=UPI002DB64758|nr:hypothetical protein [Adlercreutzia sp. R25]MEC4273616.1 hypothetical protein [Adlercreutzia sp. R25]
MGKLFQTIMQIVILAALTVVTAIPPLDNYKLSTVPRYAVGDGCLEAARAEGAPCIFAFGRDAGNGQPIIWQALFLDNDFDCRTSKKEESIYAVSQSFLGLLSNCSYVDRGAGETLETWGSDVEESLSASELNAVVETFTNGVADGVYQEAALSGDKVFLPSVADALYERELLLVSEGFADDVETPDERWWTRSRVAGDSLRAWGVNQQGKLFASYEGMRLGGRAAINIDKSNLLLTCFGLQEQGLCKDVCFTSFLERPSQCEIGDVVTMLLKSDQMPNPHCEAWERKGNLLSAQVTVDSAPEGSFLSAVVVSEDARGACSVEAFGRLAELGDRPFSQQVRMRIPLLNSNVAARELWVFVECEPAGVSREVSSCPEKVQL